MQKNNEEQQKMQQSTATQQQKSKKHIAAATIAKIAILTAISWILYVYVKFPIPFLFPSFLDVQISDLPALLGGFSMGPVWGCVIVVLKCLLKMPMTGTGCVGELADILIGIAFVLPASLIYQKNKTKKGALVGLLLGTGCAIVVAVLANRFLLIPFYVNVMFGGTIEPLVNMVSSLYNGVNAQNFYTYYLLLAVVPFNMLRCVVSAGITFAVYKSLSKILHW
ncbi:MAG: ECF transporter S component [Clostridia bacterium]|nr:ECF transporter S component [Clostridia bacterium]